MRLAGGVPRSPLPLVVGCALRLVFKSGLLLGMVFILLSQMEQYGQLVVPMRQRVERTERVELAERDDVEESLAHLGAPRKKVKQLAEAVRHAAGVTKLPRELLVALMYTESTFKENAVSDRQYKGLMQIPQEIPYPDANILVGAHILEEKMRLAKGDVHLALSMYKGGKHKSQARQQAAHTLGVYERLKSRKQGGVRVRDQQRRADLLE